MKIDLRTTDTKGRIIDEARQLYQQGGYNHINLDVIAKTLKITRPALYFHFPGGKEQLLLEVIKSVGREIAQQLQTAASCSDKVREQLRSILLSISRQPLLDHKKLIEAEIDQLTPATVQQMHEVFETVIQIISDVIEVGIKQREIRSIDPYIAVFSFMGLCQQVEQYMKLDPNMAPDFLCNFPSSIEGMSEVLLDLWFDGMGANSKL